MKTYKLFLIIVFFYTLIQSSMQYLYFGDHIFYSSFEEQVSHSQIERIIETSQKMRWVGYASFPVFVLFRVSFTAICLYTGLFFADLPARFSRIFKIALLADFVFVLSALAKLIILIFFREVSTLHDLQFQPFSVLEFFPGESFDAMLVYPLSLLNLFELGYFLVLAWLIRDLVNQESSVRPLSFGKAFRLTGISYGSGLLLWVLVVLFINLSLS